MKYHENWFTFDSFSIKDYVPPASGVYILYSHQQCVYVGVSDDIQARLRQHLTGETDSCVSQHPVDEFQFEVIVGSGRADRQTELVALLKPVCS
jgi:excinuclease UvrABC nuclease subunit